ncbi:hypothetical protein Hanom_Chr17g01523671 [Helianthus anomalus]
MVEVTYDETRLRKVHASIDYLKKKKDKEHVALFGGLLSVDKDIISSCCC